MLITGQRKVPIDNPFKQMGWKKIPLKDFSKFPVILVESQPCVVDLVGSIKKSANETQFIRIRYNAKMISQQAREGLRSSSALSFLKICF